MGHFSAMKLYCTSVLSMYVDAFVFYSCALVDQFKPWVLSEKQQILLYSTVNVS